MNTPDTRIDDLEVKIAFLEHTLSQLDDVVRELADENRLLKREIIELRQRMMAGGNPGDEMDPERYQVPPHY